MKKTLLATGMMMALGTGTASAAFTALTDGSYTMTITGGCFDFGNCVTKGSGALTDNTTPNQATAAGFGFSFGSGITNDGLMGVIEFDLTGGNISVTSFSQDAYQGTAGGTFYLRSINNGTMGGTIDGSGNMSFDPTGRVGAAANFATTIGEQVWNFDNFGAGAPNATNAWTTGTSTNRNQGLTPAFSVTGSALQDAGANMWTGTLVSAGNIGTAWGSSFQNTQYSEVFNVTITGAGNPVPVPAAAWLFGSGLVGLVGVARRRRQKS